MSTSSQNDTTEPESLLFKSIAFFIMGFLLSTWIVKDLAFWYKMREPISKIGTITKFNIEIEHYRGVGRSGGGGIREFVLAEYNYTVNGIKYNGSRPSIHSGICNIGNFERKLYNRLKKNIDKNMQVTVYINPNNPSMSCLDLTIDPLRTVLQILIPIPFLCFSFVSLSRFLNYS